MLKLMMRLEHKRQICRRRILGSSALRGRRLLMIAVVAAILGIVPSPGWLVGLPLALALGGLGFLMLFTVVLAPVSLALW